MGQLCNLQPASSSEQNCIDECVPRLTKQRNLCEESFEMMRCISSLNCDEYMDYAELVSHANYEKFYGMEYPCKSEVIEDLEQCSGPSK